MALATGTTAPEFSLYNTNKELVTLSGLRGRNVVLLFFPLAFTSVCTAELCSMRDSLSVYEGLEAEVFGISVDSLFVLDRFKEEQHLNFGLLSDFNREASRAFDVLYEVFPGFGMQGVSKRAAFVIDKEGTVQYAEECATPRDLPDFDAIRATLGSLQA